MCVLVCKRCDASFDSVYRLHQLPELGRDGDLSATRDEVCRVALRQREEKR